MPPVKNERQKRQLKTSTPLQTQELRGRGNEEPDDFSESSQDSDEEIEPNRSNSLNKSFLYDENSVDELSAQMANNLSTSDLENSSRLRRRHSGSNSNSSRLYPSLDPFLSDDSASPGRQHRCSTKTNTSSDTNMYFWIFIVVAVSFCVIFGLVFLQQNQETTASISMEDIVSGMRSKFISQDKRSWQIIRAQLRAQIAAEKRWPDRPAVLMLVGIANSLTLRCFSRKLASQVAAAFDRRVCVRADSEDNSHSSHLAKLQMDQVVQANYQQGDRCFHIQHLGSLSGGELLLLHAWCDGDSSPFKNAVFLLNLEVTQSSLLSNASDTEAKVERYLTERWNERLGPDETPALLSRVGNNKVFIREETWSDDMKKYCDM